MRDCYRCSGYTAAAINVGSDICTSPYGEVKAPQLGDDTLSPPPFFFLFCFSMFFHGS